VIDTAEVLGSPAVLLGFDARETFVPSSRAWTPGRRDDFLLRPEVEKPLSVDTWVWPSVFGDGLPEAERLGPLEVPSWRGGNDTLWDDLGRMDGSLGAVRKEVYCRIAVAWLLDDPGDARATSGGAPYVVEITPGRVERGWTLLGLDVGDRWLLSGLTNCGYEPSERTALRSRWGGELNEHHLFDRLAPARAFRDATNVRVPEHAPFFVFALFRMDDDEASQDHL